ncbi:DNA kinase/phosphatase Pnk1 [Emydomyces testavorans]|uniref:DNA kinase/phosphatase Pnk1 n=1 Tax=Emydomyces testavorans TaxID=2070801 RepID=A0AAF0IGA1_9EURO|nr:DNA kinase/phosphatase Pnk1 [Emydomyces testavorans]
MGAQKRSKRSFATVFQRTEISPPPTKRKVESTTTSGISYLIFESADEVVTNFFKPTSQKPKFQNISWRVIDNSCLVGRYSTQPPNEQQAEAPSLKKRRVAAFDLVRLEARRNAVQNSNGKLVEGSHLDCDDVRK